MSHLSKVKYSFVSKSPNAPTDAFTVVRFNGEEALSQWYSFEITLVTDHDVDPLDLMKHPAVFHVHRDQADPVDFNGILAGFEELREFRGFVFYKAVLVPKLWWLTLTHHNQVSLDCTVEDIITNGLMDGGLSPNADFEIRLQKNYPAMEYVCQYNETHFNFVTRWAEREGIYYYFDQTPAGEKIIFTDSAIAHTSLKAGPELIYSPPSGLDASALEEVVSRFTCRFRQVPHTIRLKDYNYEKPSLSVEGVAQVDPDGRGETFMYGLHFLNPEEGNRLARIRAEELMCGKTRYAGQSSVPYLTPGYHFSLTRHYRPSLNGTYLITRVRHEGHQVGWLTSGIGEALPKAEQAMHYQNRFTAIRSDVQYRPELRGAMPKISGAISAKIDSAGTGQYAELDKLGRYKVRLPFDLNKNHGDGHASAFLRLMQPYAGSAEGMHFPLRKGTEVLLSFIDGHPDRPVIAGAIPNPETISPVTQNNQSQSVIRTSADNRITLEDKSGSERIVMRTPFVDTYIRMGAPQAGLTGEEVLKTVASSAEDGSSASRGQKVNANDKQGIAVHTDGNLVEMVGRDVKRYTGGHWQQQIGTLDPTEIFPFDKTLPKGVYVKGDDHFITAGSSIQQVGVGGKDACHDFGQPPDGKSRKGVYIDGENRVVVTGNSKIEAHHGDAAGNMIIDMNNDGITIDAGNRKLNISCNNRSDIIKGEESWFTVGHKEAGFLGNDFSINLGMKESITAAGSVDLAFAPKFEGTWSDSISVALGILKVAFDFTILSMSFNTGIKIDRNVIKVDSSDLFELKEVKAEIRKGLAQLKKYKLRGSPAIIEIELADM
jgi:type VI secretion system VgrG family protein